MHIMIKNKLLLMKNIFTEQFRHFFLILFAVLLNPTAAWQRNFYYYQNKAAVIHRIYYELPYINILLFRIIYFYNYLLALLPLLSLLFCKTAAGEVITSVNIAYYSIFSLSFTSIIFFSVLLQYRI